MIEITRPVTKHELRLELAEFITGTRPRTRVLMTINQFHALLDRFAAETASNALASDKMRRIDEG